MNKGRLLRRPYHKELAFDDIDNLTGVRAENDVSAVNSNEIVSTPLRIDFYDPGRERVEPHITRNGSPDRYVEVDARYFLHFFLLDRRNDLCLLFSRRSRGRRGRSISSGLVVRSRRLRFGSRALRIPRIGGRSRESDALDLSSVFISPVVLRSAGDLISAVGFLISFELS